MRTELQSFINQVDYAGNFADGDGTFEPMVLTAVLNLLNAGIELNELSVEIERELFDSESVRGNQWLM